MHQFTNLPIYLSGWQQLTEELGEMVTNDADFSS